MVPHRVGLKTPNSIPRDFNEVKGRNKVKSFYLQLETNGLICTNVSLEIEGRTIQARDELVVIFFDIAKIKDMFFEKRNARRGELRWCPYKLLRDR